MYNKYIKNLVPVTQASAFLLPQPQAIQGPDTLTSLFTFNQYPINLGHYKGSTRKFRTQLNYQNTHNSQKNRNYRFALEYKFDHKLKKKKKAK